MAVLNPLPPVICRHGIRYISCDDCWTNYLAVRGCIDNFDAEGYRILKGDQMQRQWTIEARADFSDPDKNEFIERIVRQAAVHVNANMALLMDNNQPPQVVAYSDDFFDGHKELSLYQDTLGQAIKDHPLPEAPVSPELIAAMNDMKNEDK